MSKVDAMRALREARRAAGPQAPTRAAAVSAAPRKAAPTAAAAPSAAADEPATGLCGHRSMNGRSCTRDAGHAEKNHRYG